MKPASIRLLLAVAAPLAALSLPLRAATEHLDFVAVEAGYSHACALTASGGAKCWGDNASGQLGNGTFQPSLAPSPVVGLASGVAAISAGGYATCALTTSGGVKCWGSNYNGALGDGTYSLSSTVPVDVSGLSTGVAAISVGYSHACALTTAGGVKCWGDASFGPALGPGPVPMPGYYSVVPVDVPGLEGVTGISAGTWHGCALLGAGGLKCWGWNVFGMLGDGTLTNRAEPGYVAGLASGVASAASNDAHACAALAGGGVKCWGKNQVGQLGDGTTTGRTTPVDVIGLAASVSKVAPGSGHTCALSVTGGVSCWGDNFAGQLGDGTTTASHSAVGVTGLSEGVLSISSGFNHACALLASGGVRCWGLNSSGQLGDGTLVSRTIPTAVVNSPMTTPEAPILAPGHDTGVSSTDGLTSVTTPTMAGACTTGDTITLLVDDIPAPPAASCIAGSYAIAFATALSEGVHAIRAIATGPGGDSPPSEARIIVIDTTPPDIAFTCTPPASSADSTAEFCFSANDATGVWRVECSLDGGTFAPCTSPRNLDSLSPGAHAFAVRAVDVAGNESQSPASVTWIVGLDTTPDEFSFVARTGVVPLAPVSSDTIVIAGINTPSPISVQGGTYSIGCSGTFTTMPGTITNGQSVCVRHVAGANAVATSTTLTVGGLSATFTSTSSAIVFVPAVLQFLPEMPGTTSGLRTLHIINQGPDPVAIDSLTASAGFAVWHDCAVLAVPGHCTASVNFTPAALGLVTGTLTVASGTATWAAVLQGTGEPTLVTHYYNTILKRIPDPDGKEFWEGEAARMRSLGINVAEAYRAMAMEFFSSTEYLAYGRDGDWFVTDLYETFFMRAPDSGGLAYWMGELAAGSPAGVVLAAFLFSEEFETFMQSTLSSPPGRSEVDMVVDFYRGLLARLPDDDGFGYWVGRFRAAQCNFAQDTNSLRFAAENIALAFMSSPEYAARGRTDSQFVGDLYNAFLRRGGDAAGAQYWVGQLASGTQTRSGVLVSFAGSPEFSIRMTAVIAEGCLP